MNSVQHRFLEALKAALMWEQVDWAGDMDTQAWQALFRMAEEQHVLPMIFEAVYSCPAIGQAESGLVDFYRKRTRERVIMQTMQTSEFLKLYHFLETEGVYPLVVKGIVCRSLYPNPDYRMSGDEDLLIPEGQFEACHEAMMAYGMQLSEPDRDIQAAYEVPYGKKGSPLYIEVHKSLFPPESDAYGDFNRFFKTAGDRQQTRVIEGTGIRTLSHTDHLFYLICHAFKHFLHSGFGLRQVCDIILYANCFGKEVDWEQVLNDCRSIHGEWFAAALFQIGETWLVFDKDRACYPPCWRQMTVDAAPLLEDLLASGIYGDASMSRKHSSNLTLSAVTAQKQGRKPKRSVIRSLFPPAKALEDRYTYLRRCPWLLPAAWVSRMLQYYRETGRVRDDDAAGALQIGSQRIELLKTYKILK